MKTVKFISIFLIVVIVISMFGGIPARAGGLDFELGEVIFAMKEPYLGSITELFPELNIVEVEDFYKVSYESWKDSPYSTQNVIEELKSMIGTLIYIKIADKTMEATLNAIQFIAQHPLVRYAQPNYIYYPAGGLQVAPLTASPNGGSHKSNISVTLGCITEGALIYYTTDGTYPTVSSTKYTGPINLTKTTTIHAVALKEKMSNSEVLEVTFTIDPPLDDLYVP